MRKASASHQAASPTARAPSPALKVVAWAPFAHGFRPFFLLAGVMAPLGVGLWIASLVGLPVPAGGPLPMMRWHAHEMLAGFVGAALAGFALTAIPNWTGRRGYAGAPLIALVLVYLAGRVALLPGSPLPIGVAAPTALLFMPVLLALVLPALVRAATPRLFGPPAVILVFWCGDVLMLGDAAAWWSGPSWATGQLLCANAALLLVGLIGGRIIPSFTLNALRKAGRPAEARPWPLVDRAGILALLAVLVLDLVSPGERVAGAAALLAAVLTALRLSRWHGLRTLDQPILWILHLAYAFVPIALGTKAAWLLLGAGWAAHWLHLQGAGALAVMILAVMTRATLGHTGRDLVASPTTVAAYGLLVAAALVRGFGPLVEAQPLLLLGMAGALWVCAFVAFLASFAPKLLLARADGKAG